MISKKLRNPLLFGLLTASLLVMIGNQGCAREHANLSFALSGSGWTGDGRGDYVNGEGGVLAEWDMNIFWVRSMGTRATRMDFTHPVDPSNAPLSGVSSSPFRIRIFDIRDMKVGTTRSVGVQQSGYPPDGGDHISCDWGHTYIDHPGTVAATATHPTSTRWIVTTSPHDNCRVYANLPPDRGPLTTDPSTLYTMPYVLTINYQ